MQRRAHEERAAAAAFRIVEVDQPPARQRRRRIGVLQDHRHHVVMTQAAQHLRPGFDGRVEVRYQQHQRAARRQPAPGID